jgi:hypothetical protein
MSINDDYKKAIISFAKEKLGRDDLDFKVEYDKHHKKAFLILVVDCAKMDKNSSEFDESYYKLITREDEEKPSGIYLSFDDKVLDKITSYFIRYMNLDLGSWFHYKNYDYIDKIEGEIVDAIKKSSKPNVQIEFSGSGDKPKLTLGFYDLDKESFENHTSFNDYILELESIMGFKYNLDSYNVSRTMGSKS